MQCSRLVTSAQNLPGLPILANNVYVTWGARFCTPFRRPSDGIGVLWQIAGWTRASLAKSHFVLGIKITPEGLKN